MEYNENEILEILQRWEPTGLLYGLPPYEKEELSIIYDNLTRIFLSKKLDEKISNIIDNVLFPIARSIYKRVGGNFDCETLLNTLIEKIKNGEYEEFIKRNDLLRDGVVEFCIHFSNSYEDHETNKNFINEEEYSKRIDKILSILKEILLNDKIVSYVDRTTSDWKVITSNNVKSKKETRYHNQKISLDVLNLILKDTNKGI